MFHLVPDLPAAIPASQGKQQEEASSKTLDPKQGSNKRPIQSLNQPRKSSFCHEKGRTSH